MGFWLVVARMLEKHSDQDTENPPGPTFLRMGLGSRPDMQSLLYEEMPNSCSMSGKPQFSPLLFSTMNLTFSIKYSLLSIKLITFHMLFPMSGWQVPEKEMTRLGWEGDTQCCTTQPQHSQCLNPVEIVQSSPVTDWSPNKGRSADLGPLGSLPWVN